MFGRRFGVMCAFPVMMKSGALLHGIVISTSISPIAEVTPPPTPITRSLDGRIRLSSTFAKSGLIKVIGFPESRHIGLVGNSGLIDACIVACEGMFE